MLLCKVHVCAYRYLDGKCVLHILGMGHYTYTGTLSWVRAFHTREYCQTEARVHMVYSNTFFYAACIYPSQTAPNNADLLRGCYFHLSRFLSSSAHDLQRFYRHVSPKARAYHGYNAMRHGFFVRYWRSRLSVGLTKGFAHQAAWMRQ